MLPVVHGIANHETADADLYNIFDKLFKHIIYPDGDFYIATIWKLMEGNNRLNDCSFCVDVSKIRLNCMIILRGKML